MNQQSISLKLLLRAGALALGLWPLAPLAWAGMDEATDEAAVGRDDARRPDVSRHAAHAGMDDRVQRLSKALDLDARQQGELRKVLEAQREQVRRAWSDTSVPAAYRVGATQAISDKTADRIRALLNDGQRQKYNPPKPPHESLANSAKPSVEDWMNAVGSTK